MLEVEQAPILPELKRNGMYTSRSAHVVQSIRNRFFEEEWPKHKGNFVSVYLLFPLIS